MTLFYPIADNILRRNYRIVDIKNCHEVCVFFRLVSIVCLSCSVKHDSSYKRYFKTLLTMNFHVLLTTIFYIRITLNKKVGTYTS